MRVKSLETRQHFSEIVEQIFKFESAKIKSKLVNFSQLLEEVNKKINLVSRKTSIYAQILQSLMPLKIVDFTSCTGILDMGCGGGIPSIPLSIVMENMPFLLCDSNGKKIKSVNYFKRELGLNNIETVQERIENLEFFEGNTTISKSFTTLEKTVHILRSNQKLSNVKSLITWKGINEKFPYDFCVQKTPLVETSLGLFQDKFLITMML